MDCGGEEQTLDFDLIHRRSDSSSEPGEQITSVGFLTEGASDEMFYVTTSFEMTRGGVQKYC